MIPKIIEYERESERSASLTRGITFQYFYSLIYNFANTLVRRGKVAYSKSTLLLSLLEPKGDASIVVILLQVRSCARG